MNSSCSVSHLAIHFLATHPVDALGSFFVNSARAWQLKLLVLKVHNFEELDSVLSCCIVAVSGYLVICPLRRGTIECERMITRAIKVGLLLKNLSWSDGYAPESKSWAFFFSLSESRQLFGLTFLLRCITIVLRVGSNRGLWYLNYIKRMISSDYGFLPPQGQARGSTLSAMWWNVAFSFTLFH